MADNSESDDIMRWRRGSLYTDNPRFDVPPSVRRDNVVRSVGDAAWAITSASHEYDFEDAEDGREHAAPTGKSHKKRRKSSAGKEFRGDYLQIGMHSKVLKLLASDEQREITFADTVFQLIPDTNKLTERVVLLTEDIFYILDYNNYDVLRRIDLINIAGISMSPFADNFIVIHTFFQYSHVLVTARKTELVCRAWQNFGRLFKPGRPYHDPDSASADSLPVSFNATIIYRVNKFDVRDLVFIEDRGANNNINTIVRQHVDMDEDGPA